MYEYVARNGYRALINKGVNEDGKGKEITVIEIVNVGILFILGDLFKVTFPFFSFSISTFHADFQVEMEN